MIGLIRSPVMSWSSSTTPISSGETNSDVEHVVSDRHGADQPLRAELLGQQAADFLVDRTGFHVVADHRQEQVLGVEVGDFLLGDVAAADQGHLRQGAGLGLADSSSSISSSCLGLNQLRRDSSSRIRGGVSVSAKTLAMGDRRLSWSGWSRSGTIRGKGRYRGCV